MKVAFEPGLEGLADSLGSMGFDMVPLGQENETDAVLYQAHFQAALGARPASRGAVMLNVRGMSAGETAQALRRRAASALF